MRPARAPAANKGALNDPQRNSPNGRLDLTWLTDWSLKRGSVTLLVAIGLVFGGLYSAVSINQELMPDLDFPILTIVTANPGANPEDVADTVTTPIEAVLSGTPKMKSLQSVSAESVSIVIAQFDFGDDMREAEAEVLRRVAGVSLPAAASTPRVTRININETLPVIQIAASENGAAGELEDIVAQQLAPALKAIDGVQQVDIFGATERQINILLDVRAMQSKGVTAQQIAGLLQANNVSVPTGRVAIDGFSVPLRAVSQLDSLDAITTMIVGVDTSGSMPLPVPLSVIAEVTMGTSGRTTISRTNGNPGLSVAVTKAQNANTVKVASAAREVLEEVRAANTGRAEFDVILDQSLLIEESVEGLTREGLLGAAAAVVAIWIFLISFRSTIVAAVSIPLSVLVAVTVLFVQGFTINILTLGGMTIALGRVVDDSIVVLENIFRHVQEGDDLDHAVSAGTREVTGAVLGSTMTTVAVFLPLGFAGGITTVMFRPFALAVTFAILASLVVALTVVPILARYLVGRRQLGARRDSDERPTLVQRFYLPALRWALRRRAATLVVAAALFFGSLALLPIIPTTFLPAMGAKQFYASVSLPPGSGSEEEVLAVAVQAEQIIATLPAVDVYNTTISLGGGAGDSLALSRAIQGQGTRGATILVRLDDEADLEAVKDLARERLKVIAGAFVNIRGEGSADTNSQLQISVTGDDDETVQAAGFQVAAAIRGVDGVADIVTAAGIRQREVALVVDPRKALPFGLTGGQVAMALRELTVGQTVTRLNLPDVGNVDVVMLANPEFTSSIDRLKELELGTVATTTLGEIADVQEILAPAQVTRTDQHSSASISGRITGANTGVVQGDIQDKIDSLTLPEGVEVNPGGVLQQFNESFKSLFIGIGVAIVLVYIVMVLVMGSLRNPFVIMFCLPLASIGALSALAVTQRSLGMPSMFGFLMLVGIVVTNGIVLVDFVNQLRVRGQSVNEALLEGGRLRVRPVLMTALTTILALIPMSVGLTDGAIIAAELAVVVIGGLLTSTFLTLLVVPVVYNLVNRGGRLPRDG